MHQMQPLLEAGLERRMFTGCCPRIGDASPITDAPTVYEVTVTSVSSSRRGLELGGHDVRIGKTTGLSEASGLSVRGTVASTLDWKRQAKGTFGHPGRPGQQVGFEAACPGAAGQARGLRAEARTLDPGILCGSCGVLCTPSVFQEHSQPPAPAPPRCPPSCSAGLSAARWLEAEPVQAELGSSCLAFSLLLNVVSRGEPGHSPQPRICVSSLFWPSSQKLCFIRADETERERERERAVSKCQRRQENSACPGGLHPSHLARLPSVLFPSVTDRNPVPCLYVVSWVQRSSPTSPSLTQSLVLIGSSQGDVTPTHYMAFSSWPLSSQHLDSDQAWVSRGCSHPASLFIGPSALRASRKVGWFHFRSLLRLEGRPQYISVVSADRGLAHRPCVEGSHQVSSAPWSSLNGHFQPKSPPRSPHPGCGLLLAGIPVGVWLAKQGEDKGEGVLACWCHGRTRAGKPSFVSYRFQGLNSRKVASLGQTCPQVRQSLGQVGEKPATCVCRKPVTHPPTLREGAQPPSEEALLSLNHHEGAAPRRTPRAHQSWDSLASWLLPLCPPASHLPSSSHGHLVSLQRWPLDAAKCTGAQDIVGTCSLSPHCQLPLRTERCRSAGRRTLQARAMVSGPLRRALGHLVPQLQVGLIPRSLTTISRSRRGRVSRTVTEYTWPWRRLAGEPSKHSSLPSAPCASKSAFPFPGRLIVTQLGFQQIRTNWNAGPNPKDDGKSGLDTRGGSGGAWKQSQTFEETEVWPRDRCLSRGDERAWLSCFRGFKLEAGEQGPGQQIPGCRREESNRGERPRPEQAREKFCFVSEVGLRSLPIPAKGLPDGCESQEASEGGAEKELFTMGWGWGVHPPGPAGAPSEVAGPTRENQGPQFPLPCLSDGPPCRHKVEAIRIRESPDSEDFSPAREALAFGHRNVTAVR
ncbi:hypothetical protein Cadr_000019655 [Camelus dromedarius]|uniref:Uncharacterized protein n=1 Tax=Camelus dromedarius TaxID=9838 RepID=A0A5N4D3R3_CAMDR|nr:hypothetical protein Cadr_000019655 [Camelus dromedarius]